MDHQGQIARYRDNNIAFAKELTNKRQEIQDLRIELHEKSWDLQKTIQCLNSESDKNVMLLDQVQTMERQIERLHVALSDRNQTMNDYRSLLISLFQSQTEKYCEVLRTIGAVPSRNEAVLTKSEPVIQADESVSFTDAIVMSNPVTPEKGDIMSAPQNVSYRDDPQKSGQTLSQPCSLYPNIEIINNGDEPEFSEDSTSQTPSKPTSSSIKVENGLEGASTVTEKQSKKYVIASPKIIITNCQNIENPKRKSNESFLRVPKFSFGIRKSEPKSPFNTRSPTLPHRGNSVRLSTSVRIRSTSLNKIIEASGEASSTTKSAGLMNQSNIAPFNVLSSKSPFNIFTNNPKNVRASKSPTVPINPNISSNGSISSSRSSKSPLNSPNNKKIQPISAIPKWCHPKDSPMNKTNGIVSTGQTPKSPLLNVANKKNQSKNSIANSHSVKNSLNKVVKKENDLNGSIARSRPKRHAAPTDLREPLLKNKMRRNF